MGKKLTITLFLMCALTLSLALNRSWIRVPKQWNPWATLEIRDEPTFLTSFKLSRLTHNPELCRQVLSNTDFRYRVLTDRETGSGCGFRNAVTIEGTNLHVEEPFSLTCRAAISLALWEQHTLLPAALEIFGKPVALLEHFGSYSCRNVYGRTEATRSRHATAEALDVAGFILTDGQRVRVLKDWGTESKNGLFLRTARDGACNFFDGVLGPEYNEAHRDHFHLDRGSYRICR